MIVLHAGFTAGQLLVWHEPEAGKAPLLAATNQLDSGLKFTRRDAGEAIAWLPTHDERVAPSSALADGDPLGEGDCYLAPHAVTTLPLDPRQAVNLLAACAGKRVAAPGVLVGDDLAYWTAALRFAATLAQRGQFLPSVVREEAGYAARWTPVAAGPDAARLDALAKAMPPAARCLTYEEHDQPPAPPAATVLLEFVTVIVDSLLRTGTLRRPGALDSLHDRWQAALRSPDPTLAGTEEELAAFAGQVEEWQRPVRMATRAPFRLSFRLHEPEADADEWQVRYLLQGTKDPSLLVPAGDAWNAKRAAAVPFAGDPGALREHLLASLGQAAAICPFVEASLKQAAPDGYAVGTAGAYQFLRETAGALERSGFGVMLPGWWTRRDGQARLQAHARVKSPAAAAGLSLDTLVEFDWRLALGGEEMSRAELTALARLKQPLVKLRGQWVEVDAAQIAEALDFLKNKRGGKLTVRDAMRMAIGADAQAGSIEIGGVSASGWVGEILDRLQGRTPFAELPQPAGLQGELRPYQLRGFSWLDFLKQLGLGACLADDMGLGKTIQTLALIEHDRAAGETRPVLLVCPTSVVNNWHKEAARFVPALPVLVHHGLTRARGAAFRKSAKGQAIVVSSYALLQRDREAFASVDWAGVILDEAQNIKNAATKQAQAARSLAGGYRIALTGTPVENNVRDLWSLMEFLNPGFLGSQGAFHRRFFVPIQVYADHAASDRLRRITTPFILRRLKTDKSVISDLPDKFEMKVYCNLTKEQASLYEAVVKNTREAIESASGIERKGLVLATLLKLKQVCNHPAQFLKDRSAIGSRSGKLARITEMIEETLGENDRSLIFTQFTEMGDILQRHLQETFGIEVLYLHGAVTKKRRDQMVERFADAAGPRIFLLSLKAGGTGLNLTQANHVFHFDRWWNPAVENQATDRAFRIGQTKNVQVHKFVCAGTLEEKIDEMIERKKDVAGRVVGTGEAWLGELSNTQLRELFELRKDAVGE
jgi:SNF2 family DNA or RNA helicase